MNFKAKIRGIMSRAAKIKVVSKKKLTTSYVSLFLIFAMSIVTTFSWFTVNDTATVDSQTFSLESASGLRVNEGEDISNHIKISGTLGEASSVDGRNIYFPTTGTFTSDTDEIVFREGTVGDQNETYIYKNVTLTGDSENTYVYIKSYSIVLTGTDTNGDAYKETFDGSTEIIYDSSGYASDVVTHEECPVRIAFIGDSEDDPTVIDPTALVSNYVNNYEAVLSTFSNGYASTEESTADPFSMYYYVTGQPLFTIQSGETIDSTMVVWLEGGDNTDDNSSNCDRYAGATISIDIELESNWNDMETIQFVDNTVGDDGSLSSWISNDDNLVTMTYVDVTATNNPTRTIVMTKGEGTVTINGKACNYWYAPIPTEVVTDITFNRYDPNNEQINNAWYTCSNVMELFGNSTMPLPTLDGTKVELETTRETASGDRYVRYTALRGNGNGEVPSTDKNATTLRLSPCIGYWAYSYLEKVESGDKGTSTLPSSGSSGDSPVVSGDTVTVDQLNLDTSKRSWIEQDLQSGYYELRVEFSDGNVYKLSGTNNKYTVSSFDITGGASIERFYLFNTTDRTEQTLYMASVYTITNGNYNYNFYVGTDDKVYSNN